MQSIKRATIFMIATLFGANIGMAQNSGTAEVDQAYKALDPRSRDVVEAYLRTDCEIGEVGAALKSVLQAGEIVKPYLVAVPREGPPSPVLSEFERGLNQTWEARQEFLKTPDALELGQQSFEMMKAITRDQYRKDQFQAIQAKYRERAALALEKIGVKGDR